MSLGLSALTCLTQSQLDLSREYLMLLRANELGCGVTPRLAPCRASALTHPPELCRSPYRALQAVLQEPVQIWQVWSWKPRAVFSQCWAGANKPSWAHARCPCGATKQQTGKLPRRDSLELTIWECREKERCSGISRSCFVITLTVLPCCKKLKSFAMA